MHSMDAVWFVARLSARWQLVLVEQTTSSRSTTSLELPMHHMSKQQHSRRTWRSPMSSTVQQLYQSAAECYVLLCVIPCQHQLTSLAALCAAGRLCWAAAHAWTGAWSGL
jgi:hypothetical protein